MAFCVCAMSLSTVSCTKEIEADIANLKEQVADLAKKLADLEARLTSEVNAINTAVAAVEAKVAVVNVESKDGNVTLTLANGDKVTVAVPDANANNTGLITTVTENGKNYWAVVGADGKAQSLGIEVGHLAVKLSFKVDPETKELLVSYDGKEYEGTGVLVKDPDEYDHIISAFEEGEDYVTFTIGEATYTLPKYVEDNASLVIGRTDFFLRYEGVKEVELTVEGIADYYVMNEPDGWKATIEGNILTVTAPTKKAIEIGAAEKEGLVLVHATTDQGKCKVAKVAVKAGPGLTLDVDINGNITITNAYIGEYTERLGWESITAYGFQSFAMGLATPAFLEDVEGFMTVVHDNYEVPDGSYYIADAYGSTFNRGLYEDKVYEKDIIETSVTSIIEDIFYGEIAYGDKIVVWAAPTDEEGRVISSDVVYSEYTCIELIYELTNITHNDATLTMTLHGATRFYIGINQAYEGYDAETIFSEGGIWMYLQNPQYMEYYSGYSVTEADNVTINLSELNYDEPLAFGTKYYAFVFPYFEGTAYTDYETQFAPYVIELTTNELQAGGAYEVTLGEAELGYDYISVPVALSEGTESVYYAWYSVEDYAEFADDDAVRESVIENCYNPMTEDGVIDETYLNPGETWILAAIAIGADGKYGELVEGTYQTKALPKVETITVALEELTLADNMYTAVLNVTGATKIVGYNLSTNSNEEYELNNINYFYKNIVTKTNKYSSYQWVDVVEGKATVTFKSSSSKKDYYVVGYNVDEAGVVTEVQSVPLVFNLASNLPAEEE